MERTVKEIFFPGESQRGSPSLHIEKDRPDSSATQVATNTSFSNDVQLLVMANKPDLVFVDWKLEPVLLLNECHPPLAVIWPNEAWNEYQSSSTYIESLRRDSESEHSSTREALGLKTGISLLRKWGCWIAGSPSDRGLRIRGAPKTITLVNSFFDLIYPALLSPSILMVGPVLADKYSALSQELASFLDRHQRVIYINLGAQADFSAFEIQSIMMGLILALEQGHITGVVWATHPLRRQHFFDVYEPLLDGQDPRWRISPFVPQRAILAHSSTRLFLSQGGSSAFNEAMYHGVPLLTIYKDHLLNLKPAELMGVALSLSQYNINANDICKKVGLIIQDVYCSFQNAIVFMQGVAVSSSYRKELAAGMIEEFIGAGKDSLTCSAQGPGVIPR